MSLSPAPTPLTVVLAVGAAVAAGLAAVACGSGPTDGPKAPEAPLVVGGVLGDAGLTSPLAQGSGAAPEGRGRGRGRSAAAPAEPKRAPAESGEDALGDAPVPEAGPDPLGGVFTLAAATAGLPASGPLGATIKTSKGELRCKLLDDKAPVAVANFVGLARGTRPFKDRGRWVTRSAYDGTTFHRIIKGFMIQGGDPQGTGRGEPGYVFKDELWTGPGSKHDRPGLLCMANRGPDTNGMQFFITDAAAPHLDRSYTIFGECSPVSVVHAIASVAVDPGDRPQDEVSIEAVIITRGGVATPAGVAPPTAPAKEAAPPARAAPSASSPASPSSSPVPSASPAQKP